MGTLTRLCKRCGVAALLTTGATPRVRAHKCPHGRACVLPYAQRRIGKRAANCTACFASKQLALPFEHEAAE
jgi:hypothetical protein